MKARIIASLSLVLGISLGLGIALYPPDSANGPAVLAAAPVPDNKPTRPAFVVGESIPKKNVEPAFGINAERIEWWIGNPDGKNLRKLEEPKSGRQPVRPVGHTIVLKRSEEELTLLGPDGGDLTFSLVKGPLAEAKIHFPGQVTTFCYSLDGKSVVFVNEKDQICFIELATKKLTVTKLTGANHAESVWYSPDGKRILYSKYFRKDDFSQGVRTLYVANADFTGEKKLNSYAGESGYGFLPDGRVGVVGARAIRAIDPETDKAEPFGKPWPKNLEYRVFAGFGPDGTTFLFDRGGPYDLALFLFDTNTQKETTVIPHYLESFQSVIWVKVPEK